jgi:tryptophan synthase beta subunit
VQQYKQSVGIGAMDAERPENVMTEAWLGRVALITLGGSAPSNFVGTVFRTVEDFEDCNQKSFMLVYVLASSSDDAPLKGIKVPRDARLVAVQDWSQLPLNLHGVGVLFPRFPFPDLSKDYYAAINGEHKFQSLKVRRLD